MTPVVAGVLRRNGRFMLARRLRGRDAGRWEFPGGKLECGESPPAALKRELREELGISVRVEELMGCVIDWAALDGEGIVLLFYACSLTAGEPVCLDCAGVAFVSSGELARMNLAPNDERFAQEVLLRHGL